MTAVHMRLADALEACGEPENEDVVIAILAGLLAPPRLSSKAASRGYENLLAEHDFAEIEALRRLTEDHLMKLGVGMGHAAQVIAAIRPPIKEVELPDLVPADEDSNTQPQRKRSGKVAAPGSFCNSTIQTLFSRQLFTVILDSRVQFANRCSPPMQVVGISHQLLSRTIWRTPDQD